MKLKLLLAFLFMDIAAFAQNTLIPDINFEKQLIALKIDSGTPDGKVLTSKVKSVVSLDIASSEIKDLTGIQSFLSLQFLICDQNNLAKLDISKNTKLQFLSIESNQLKSLDVSKNTALTHLNCRNSQLWSLDVSNNIVLADLYVSTNGLTNLDVSKNRVLVNLECDANKLTTLDVSNNTALKTLSFTANKIATIDLSKNTALTTLQCMENEMTSLNVSNNTSLTELYCYSNSLSTLDVSNNWDLTSLNAETNSLTTLDLTKNKKLKYLYCNGNHLLSLNLKSGFNANFSKLSFELNPNLACIQVDDKAYADSHWSTSKAKTSSFSTTCSNSVAAANTMVFGKMYIYPNPTKGELHVDNVNMEKAEVYDAVGNQIFTTVFENPTSKNTLNLSGLAKGIYYLFIYAEGTETTAKIAID